MIKTVALLLGVTVAILAAPGPARAGGGGGETELQMSLPIGVTGPPTSDLDRLHTVPRLPPGSSDAAAASANDERPPLQALKPDGIVTVSQ
jgi:hypothetical protein